jgi:hypothetical protein
MVSSGVSYLHYYVVFNKDVFKHDNLVSAMTYVLCSWNKVLKWYQHSFLEKKKRTNLVVAAIISRKLSRN